VGAESSFQAVRQDFHLMKMSRPLHSRTYGAVASGVGSGLTSDVAVVLIMVGARWWFAGSRVALIQSMRGRAGCGPPPCRTDLVERPRSG